MPDPQTDTPAALFVPHRFEVSFSHQFAPSRQAREQLGSRFELTESKGAFSEISGLEINTTPKTIKEGGRNWGEVQLPAPVSFPNLILKRGITRDAELWQWYQFIYQRGIYAYRADCTIEVREPGIDAQDAPRVRMRWVARRCLPVRFKGSDLNATATAVAIEELHLAHEGLELEWVEDSGGGNGNAT